MRRMLVALRRVTKPAVAVWISLSFVSLRGPALAQQPLPLIDLVANPIIDGTWPSQSGRVTSVFEGTPTHQPPRPQPTLPLEIRLESISADNAADHIFIVEMIITNIGEAPFRLPVGRDPDKVMRRDVTDRHHFGFALRAPGGTTIYGSTWTFSSAADPDSVRVLAPGTGARIRYAANLTGELYRWKQEARTEVEFEAVCIDTKYEDNPDDPEGFLVRLPTPRASSTNRLTLSLE